MNLFITHRDIAHRLRSAKNVPWVQLESNPYEIRLYVASEAEGKIPEALARVLSGTWDPDRSAVKLESVAGHDRWLPIHLTPPPEEVLSSVTRPLWKGEGLVNLEPFKVGCKIASFHSYKGGVGRTTTLVATLGALLRRPMPPRVLVIDADIEAPGLTWMLRHPDDEAISLLDFLALVHDSDDWRAEAVPLAAASVLAHPVTLDLSEVGRREVFFLPAIRGTRDLLVPPVVPEQVVRRHGRAFVIGDAIHALAQALDVNVVLLDARAGISEFASPLFLDPRIESFAVTTCDTQSVEGTLIALDSARQRGVVRTSVVVSMVPPGEAGERAFAVVSDRLIESLVGSSPSTETITQADANIEVLRGDFAQELLGGASLEDLLGTRLPGTSLGKDVGPRLGARLVPSPVSSSPAPVMGAIPFSLSGFIKLTERMEYAERNAEQGLLSIPALRALVEITPSQMPNRVVLGAKGAGKTFAWAQMVLAGDWRSFCERIRGAGVMDAVPIVSLLQSEDLGDGLLAQAQAAEQTLGLGGTSPIDAMAELEKRVDQDPVSVWVFVIRARLGLAQSDPPTVVGLLSQIRERFGRIILVTDGLESFFQLEPGVPINEGKRRLLRALLQEVPNRLRDEPGCPLGLVSFIRRDLAAAVITQNFGQFEARHSETALRWSPPDAIRLVSWLLSSAGWPPILGIPINDAPVEQLISVLNEFWNEKLGGARDASTWRWVLAALSDFNAGVQARDLVRFLRAAAQQHGGGALPLSPVSLRNALPEVSAKKVEELQSEIPGLRPVFEKLRSVAVDQRVVPFVPSDLGITPEEVAFLEQLGLLIRPDHPTDNAYLQEVVRHGLGYGLGRRGRARIVSLYTQALRRAG